MVFLAPQLSSVASDLLEPPTINDLSRLPHDKRVLIVSANLPNDLALVEAHFPGVTPLAHYGIHGDLLFTSFEISASQP